MRTSRILALAAVAPLTVGLAACGGNDQNASSSSTTSASQTTSVEAGGPSAGSTFSNGKERAPLPPANVDDKTQGLVANPDGPATNTLSIYVDPQCPLCKKAEDASGEMVAKSAEEKTARVLVHPMTFLDENVKNDSSKVMANALACASDAKGKLLPYMKEMFAVQPATEGDGYAKDAPGKIADKVGITGAERTAFDACVAGNTYAPWIAAAQEKYAAAGVNGTPTYIHNGQKVDLANISQEDFQKKLAGSK